MNVLGVVEDRIHVAPNLFGAVLPRDDFRRAPPGTALRVVFLSRIVRNKNLDLALKILRQVSIPVCFDIWGPQEDSGYWSECRALMDTLPDNVRVSYHGIAEHAKVPGVLCRYDLLFLPTAGENFGHVIAEALSVGLPVLISDLTPWRDLHHAGVGWDLPLQPDPGAFVAAMTEAWTRRDREGARWRRQVQAYAAARLNDPAVIKANRQLLLGPPGDHGPA